MTQEQTTVIENNPEVKRMLSESGYSNTAIDYYVNQPHMGTITDADQISQMTGTCGDTMAVYLKVEDNIVQDVKYQVMGCAGAISAAMAAVDLVKGKSLEEAQNLNDGAIFNVLEDIPSKKHHCIQLAVKALQKALKDYSNGNGHQDQ